MDCVRSRHGGCFLDLPAGQRLCWFSRGTRSVIPDVSDLWRSTRQDGLPAQDTQ